MYSKRYSGPGSLENPVVFYVPCRLDDNSLGKAFGSRLVSQFGHAFLSTFKLSNNVFAANSPPNSPPYYSKDTLAHEVLHLLEATPATTAANEHSPNSSSAIFTNSRIISDSDYLSSKRLLVDEELRVFRSEFLTDPDE